MSDGSINVVENVNETKPLIKAKISWPMALAAVSMLAKSKSEFKQADVTVLEEILEVVKSKAV